MLHVLSAKIITNLTYTDLRIKLVKTQQLLPNRQSNPSANRHYRVGRTFFTRRWLKESALCAVGVGALLISSPYTHGVCLWCMTENQVREKVNIR